MTNNDILRRLRYTFDLRDNQIVKICNHVKFEVPIQQVILWLKKEDDPDVVEMKDVELASFLNGFIVEKRGKKDGPLPLAERQLNNNIVFRKIKIALNLKVEDIVELLASIDLRVSKPEITALFRKPSQKQYRPCQNQFLRNFLLGLQKKHRP